MARQPSAKVEEKKASAKMGAAPDLKGRADLITRITDARGVFVLILLIVESAFGLAIFAIPESSRFWAFVIFVLIVAAGGYLVSRLMFREAEPMVELPKINGTWKYRCTKENSDYQHGGVCTLKVTPTPFGPEFTISGTRLWYAEKKEGKWEKKILDPPFDWENRWGAITSENRLRYDYSISTPGGIVRGYAWASIQCDGKGSPTSLVGNFYQLPPYRPFFGRQEFQRTKSLSDTEWELAASAAEP